MVRERGEASFETGVPVVYSILVEEKRLQHLSDVTLVVGVLHWVCVSDRVWWPGGFGYWMLKG